MASPLYLLPYFLGFFMRLRCLLIACLLASPFAVLADNINKEWGYWNDHDKDCQNTETEFLIDKSLDPVEYSKDNCKITAGTWISSYTGELIVKRKKIVVDHIISTEWALEHGAESWSSEKKSIFANDTQNLLAVDKRSVKKKNNRSPAKYLPVTNQCSYAKRWESLLKKYELAPPKKLEKTLKLTIYKTSLKKTK